MNLRRICAMVVAVSVSAAQWVSAEEPEALASTLVELMGVENNIRESHEMARKAAEAQMQMVMRRMPAGADLEKFKQQQEKILQAIEEELSWANLKKDYIQLYSELFSADELKALIEFYRSPAGRAFVAKQPELMRRSVEMHQRHMLRLQPKINEILKGAVGESSEPRSAP